jgi:hypothetical protein
VPSTPSITPRLQALFRRKADEHRFGLVDLPRILERESGGAPPGRDAFLDYCHMTSAAMGATVAAIGSAVLRGGRATATASVGGSNVPTETEARARLLSALLTLHRGTPAEAARTDSTDRVARHFVDSALSIWPDGGKFLASYIESRAAPTWAMPLSAATQSMTAGLGDLFAYASLHDNVDGGAVRLLVELLADRAPPLGSSVGAAIRTLVENHGVVSEPRDLAEPVYRWLSSDAEDRPGPFGAAEEGFIRARWPACRFCLVCDATRDVDLEITARLPESEAPRRDTVLSVFVNDALADTASLGTRWTATHVRVPSQELQYGVNRITLRWPALPPDGDRALRRIVQRLESGLPADLHPVFGELFSLSARAVG